MKYKDYYAILGLKRGANESEIKSAYRKLAHKFHPDVSKEANAEEKFKEIAEAYQTLKDPEKRAAYEQLGTHAEGQEFRPPPDWQRHWREASGSGDGAQFGEEFDLGDLFAHFGAGRARAGAGAGAGASISMPGQDFELSVPISVEDAYHGTELDLDLSMPEYDAQGRVRRVPQAFKARIPKGATDGQRLRVPGKGGRGHNGGRSGDLFLIIRLRPHPLYRVTGHDLYLDLPLAPWEAVLGTAVEVPTPGGTVRLKVPAGTQAAQQLRLPHRGLPIPGEGQGDLYAVAQIVVSSSINEEDRALYRQLSERSTFNPRAHFSQESSHAH